MATVTDADERARATDEDGTPGQDNAAFDETDHVGIAAGEEVGEDDEGGEGEPVEEKSPEAVVVVVNAEPADKPYSGMGKEDLLRFSETPFWKLFRLVSILLFWAAFLALVGAVIGLTIVAPRCGDRQQPEWWQKAVVYQIYVRSFFDTSNDVDIGAGIGDINGVTAKLEYLKELNVNSILLSSVYRSTGDRDSLTPPPELYDHGYELLDHKNISADCGTLDDLQQLITAAHDMDIAVLLDFIPNYTGLEHDWFNQSANSSDYSHPYWNYYVWARCDDALSPPPNNWLSVYGGSAWTYNEDRGQCYLHQFLSTQPELNLRSSSVQRELEEILRFWLDLGIDGFKVSSSKYLFESADLQDEPVVENCTVTPLDYSCLQHIHTTSQPEGYALIGRWRAIVDEYTAKNASRPRVLLTDADVVDVTEALRYYGPRADVSQLPASYIWSRFNQSAISCHSAMCLYNETKHWLQSKRSDTTASWLLSDADRPRLKSLTEDRADEVHALHVLTLTLPGTALVYYGNEIGMTDYNGTRQRDSAGLRDPSRSRDPYRTPMQWTDELNANFTTSTDLDKIWLEVNPNYNETNVAKQKDEPYSILGIFRQLTELRAEEASLQYGAMHFVTPPTNSDLIAYVREHEGFDRLLVLINLSGTTIQNVDLRRSSPTIKLPSNAELVLKTDAQFPVNVGSNVNLKSFTLGPRVALIVKWEYQRP